MKVKMSKNMFPSELNKKQRESKISLLKLTVIIIFFIITNLRGKTCL